MKWGNDPLREEKYFLYDGIIKFSQEVKGKSFVDISLKELMDFVDMFTDTRLMRKKDVR